MLVAAISVVGAIALCSPLGLAGQDSNSMAHRFDLKVVGVLEHIFLLLSFPIKEMLGLVHCLLFLSLN